jgi:hypothetical protein
LAFIHPAKSKAWNVIDKDKPWWEHSESEDCAREVAAVIDHLENNQSTRTHENLQYLSLYSNRPLTGASHFSSAGTGPLYPRQIVNTTHAIVNTMLAKHVQNESKAAFFVNDGDWDVKVRAEALDTGVFGEFERIDVYQKAEMVLRDALLVGDGWLKFASREHKNQEKVYAERTFPLEILIDEDACISSPPTEMYQRRYLPKSWMKTHFPDAGDQLHELPTAYPPYAWPGAGQTALIRLDEAWHLPDPDGKKGRHVICCRHISLLDEPWESDDFPFQRISWDPSPMGGYAQGLVEQLAPQQLELNKLLKRIHQAIHLLAVPRIWKQAGARITPNLDNLVGNIYSYTGMKPEIDISPSVNPELFRQTDWIESRMYKMARLSPIEAQGSMPSRLDSRPALREHAELASTSHAWVSIMWERFFTGCAKHIIRIASAIPNYEVMGRNGDTVMTYKWSEMDLPENSYRIKMAPVSRQPETPTGRRLLAEQIIQSGVITDSQQILELMIDVPDIKALLHRETADRRLIEKQMWLITRTQKYLGPDTMQDPVAALRIAQQTYIQMIMRNAPQKVLGLVSQYIRDAQALLPVPAEPAPDLTGAIPNAGPIPANPAPGAPVSAPAPGDLGIGPV